MRHIFRNSPSLAVLVVLAASFTGCRTPEAGVEKSWSERMSEKVSFWKKPEWEQQKQEHDKASQLVSVPGPKPDEKMTAALMLEHEGKVERAIALYEEIVVKDRNRGDVHHRLAQLYDINGEPDKALKHYQVAVKQYPKDTDLLCDFGYHYYLVGQPAESEKLLRQAIKFQPTLARAHNNLGLVMAQRGRSEEALAEFKRAGNSVDAAHVNLAYALMWDEHWAEAGQQIDKALAAEPNSKVALKAQASMKSVVSTVNASQQVR